MNKQKTLMFLAILLNIGVSLFALSFVPASDTFNISDRDPDIKITANTMMVKNDIVPLEGNVKAKRKGDLLTCNRAILCNSPQWLLASLTPRLYRRENMLEEKLVREISIEARSIFIDGDNGKFNASDSVNVKIEERTWDMKTYNWVTIASNDMIGYREDSRMVFTGNVKFRDQDNNFGNGQHLDYQKEVSMITLSGNAMVEVLERNEKNGKMEKRILKGERITYNTESKEAISE